MEMSGNVWERTVTVGNVTGRLFTATTGDGILDSTGNADVGFWPGSNAIGAGYRGGIWAATTVALRTSTRSNAASVYGGVRYNGCGFRGVR